MIGWGRGFAAPPPVQRMNIAIPNYTENRAWSDTYLPDVKRIVGSHLLSAAPDDIDMQQATDLLMLDARDMRVAARCADPATQTGFRMSSPFARASRPVARPSFPRSSTAMEIGCFTAMPIRAAE